MTSKMQRFEEEFCRAEGRRFLAERRISYGNAASNCNMRSRRVTEAHSGSFPEQQPHSQISARSRISLSNGFNWQMGDGGSLLTKQPSPPRTPLPMRRRKEMCWLPMVSPVHGVTWEDTVSQYETLQKMPLAKSKEGDFLVDKYKFVQ